MKEEETIQIYCTKNVNGVDSVRIGKGDHMFTIYAHDKPARLNIPAAIKLRNELNKWIATFRNNNAKTI